MEEDDVEDGEGGQGDDSAEQEEVPAWDNVLTSTLIAPKSPHGVDLVQLFGKPPPLENLKATGKARV